TTQTLAVYGDLKAEISIWNGDTEVLTTQTFTITVFEMLRSDNTVESTNEFGVLVTLFQSIQNSLDAMNAIKTNFGEAGQKAAEYGAATFWRMLEVLAGKTEEAIQLDVSGKIGEPTDTTGNTVFGKFKTALNSTIGTDSFQPLNELLISHINGGTQTFTANGTFTVPDGVTKIWVTACAGGQGGLGNSNCAMGGNGGEWIFKQPYNVAAGQSIAITIGTGGNFVASGVTTDQIAGGNTVIGSLVTLLGGGVSGNTNGGHGACYIAASNSLSYFATDGFAGGGVSQGTYSGGGGSLGRGMDADGKTPYTVGYGGGGMGKTTSITAKAGNGIVIIEW
ncbi:MAG: hypothetical protein PHX08_14215, partial [Lachnospiraceae bacterium]|nr:hypothetical protein [Lachnospiraceae bacterium]